MFDISMGSINYVKILESSRKVWYSTKQKRATNVFIKTFIKQPIFWKNSKENQNLSRPSDHAVSEAFLKCRVNTIFQNSNLSRKVHFERLGYAVSKGCPFRIISPLRGLKFSDKTQERGFSPFRIISPLRGLKSFIFLICLLVKSTPVFRIISPLRGLKLSICISTGWFINLQNYFPIAGTSGYRQPFG